MRFANQPSAFAIMSVLMAGPVGCLRGIPDNLLAGDSGEASSGQGSGGDGASDSGNGSSGVGGNGGSSGTGIPICAPLAQAPCYSGTPGTEGIGVCTGGVMTCLADGSAFGPCEGETVPTLSLIHI